MTYAGSHLLVLGNALQPQHKLSTVEAVLIASFCKVFPSLFKLDNSQLHKAWQVSFCPCSETISRVQWSLQFLTLDRLKLGRVYIYLELHVTCHLHGFPLMSL